MTPDELQGDLFVRHDFPPDFHDLAAAVCAQWNLRRQEWRSLCERARAAGVDPLTHKQAVAFSGLIVAWSERMTPRRLKLGGRYVRGINGRAQKVAPGVELNTADFRDWLVREGREAARADLLGLPYSVDPCDALDEDPRRPVGRVEVDTDPDSLSATLEAASSPFTPGFSGALELLRDLATPQQRRMLDTFVAIGARTPDDVDRALGLAHGQTRVQFRRIARTASGVLSSRDAA